MNVTAKISEISCVTKIVIVNHECVSVWIAYTWELKNQHKITFIHTFNYIIGVYLV